MKFFFPIPVTIERWQRSIADALILHGVPVFFSPSNLVSAQQLQEEILKALRRCDWFLVLLSPEAVESMWVKREIRSLKEQRYENRVIPLQFRPCDMTRVEGPKLFQMADFSGDFRMGCRELLQTWGIGLRSEGF